MSVSVCMFALSTLRVTKFLLKNFTTTTYQPADGTSGHSENMAPYNSID